MPHPIRSSLATLALLLTAAGVGRAASAASVLSVVDAAGYGPRVAPGSIATLFGNNLASGTALAGSFPLPTSLQSATVKVGGTASPLLYVSPTQINFQIPSSVASGSRSLVVTGPGGSSASFSFTVVSAAPSIFQNGSNASAQNADGTPNSAANPAAAGSVITVYMTGQGALDHAVADGTAAPSSPLSNATAASSATMGPLSAAVQFLGLAPGFAGLAQANIQVPALPTGDYPLVITIGGRVSASATISVSGSGAAYTSLLAPYRSVNFPNSQVSGIALYNSIAYVCGAGQITMVDLTNIAAPALIGSFGASILNGLGGKCVISATSATPFLVDIVGTTSSTLESFAVFSLNNPRSPALYTVASTSWSYMQDLSFLANFGVATTSYLTSYNSNSAVASQTGDLLVFDFTNPAAPVFLSAMQPSSNAGSGDQNLKPYAAVVNQLYAYIASSTATGTSTAGTAFLDVVSLASPTTPFPVSLVTVPQAAILLSFDIAGNTLLAAGNTAGERNPGIPDFDFTGYLTLTTMDVTNAAAPAVLATVTTQIQAAGTFCTAAFSNGVFAIVNNPPETDNFGPASIMIADARAPANILLYPFQTAFGFSGLLTTANGYLLAPTMLGLSIYQLQQ